MAKGEKIMNIFERAARERVRFNYMGSMMTEDLWDLSIEHLDDLYRKINVDLKDQSGESLIKNADINDFASALQLQADLVRYVFGIKQELAKANQNEKVRQEKKKRIMELIANKQDQALSDMPTEELMKMLDEM